MEGKHDDNVAFTFDSIVIPGRNSEALAVNLARQFFQQMSKAGFRSEADFTRCDGTRQLPDGKSGGIQEKNSALALIKSASLE